MATWRTRTVAVNHGGTAANIIPGTNLCIVLMSDPAGNNALYKLNTKTCKVQQVHEGPHLTYDFGQIGPNRISADDKYLVGVVEGDVVVTEIDTWSTVSRDALKLDNSDHFAYVVGNYIIWVDKRKGTIYGRSVVLNFKLEHNQLSQIFAAKHHLVTCGGGVMTILDMRSMELTEMPASCITYGDPVGHGDGVLYCKHDGRECLYDLAGTNLTAIFNRFHATLSDRFQEYLYLVSFQDGTVLFKLNHHFISVSRQMMKSFIIPAGGWLHSIKRVGSNMFTYVTQDEIFLFTTFGYLVYVEKRTCSKKGLFNISSYREAVVIFFFHCNKFQIISKTHPDSGNTKTGNGAESTDKHNLSTTMPNLCSRHQIEASLPDDATYSAQTSMSLWSGTAAVTI